MRRLVRYALRALLIAMLIPFAAVATMLALDELGRHPFHRHSGCELMQRIVVSSDLGAATLPSTKLRTVHLDADLGITPAASDLVDVILTVRDPQQDQLVTRTLLQAVAVRAASRGETFLEVLPEEAELLHEAKALGTLTLTRRAPGDIAYAEDLSRTSVNTLLSGEHMPHACRHFPIVIIRGERERR